jgi:hypothetical protein
VHRRLIDPSKTESKLLPRSADDIMIGAQHSWMQSFDNVSPPIPEESGDALCVISTGGSKEKRRLYKDDEGHVIAVRRPIIMTGILDILTRPDLVSRTLFREVEEIPSKRRVTEQKFWKEFDEVHARVLGALLDAVVSGRGQPEPDFDELPRMADAAAWVTRCEAALGWAPGTFADAMKRNAEDSLDILLGGDPVADAVRELMDGVEAQPDGTKLWEGLVTDLMQALRKKLGEGVYRTRGLPKQPNILSSALRRASPALAKVGLLVRLQHTNKGSAVTLFIDKPPPEEPDPTDGAENHNRDEYHPADGEAHGGAADGSDAQNSIDGTNSRAKPSSPSSPSTHPAENQEFSGDGWGDDGASGPSPGPPRASSPERETMPDRGVPSSLSSQSPRSSPPSSPGNPQKSGESCDGDDGDDVSGHEFVPPNKFGAPVSDAQAASGLINNHKAKNSRKRGRI